MDIKLPRSSKGRLSKTLISDHERKTSKPKTNSNTIASGTKPISTSDVRKHSNLPGSSNLNIERRIKAEERSQSLKQLHKTAATSLDQKSRDNLKKEDAKKKSSSQPDLTAISNDLNAADSLQSIRDKIMKSCYCDDSGPQARHREILSRWDNLLTILLIAMIIVLLMSAPFSFFLGRRRDR